MYNEFKEDWQYNEWPDVDLTGKIIKRKPLSESCNKYEKLKEEAETDEYKDVEEISEEEHCEFCEALIEILDSLKEDSDFDSEEVANTVLDLVKANYDALGEKFAQEDEEVEDKEALEDIQEGIFGNKNPKVFYSVRPVFTSSDADRDNKLYNKYLKKSINDKQKALQYAQSVISEIKAKYPEAAPDNDDFTFWVSVFANIGDENARKCIWTNDAKADLRGYGDHDDSSVFNFKKLADEYKMDVAQITGMSKEDVFYEL